MATDGFIYTGVWAIPLIILFIYGCSNVAMACIIVLLTAYIMFNMPPQKGVEAPIHPMQYTTHIQPFEMDVVELQQGESGRDDWAEWEAKYNDNTHIQRWRNMFNSDTDEFNGFNLL